MTQLQAPPWTSACDRAPDPDDSELAVAIGEPDGGPDGGCTLGTACPQDFRGVALARDGEIYDVVVSDPACSTARFRLTPALGMLTAAAGP